MIFTLMLGGITHHFISPNLNYCGLINDVGTIRNEYVVGLVGNELAKVGFIKGKDSACANIFGTVGTVRITDNLDFIVGGYNTNYREFKSRKIDPPSIDGVTPIVGLNLKLPLFKTPTTSVSLDNIVSMGIISHAISFTF